MVVTDVPTDVLILLLLVDLEFFVALFHSSHSDLTRDIIRSSHRRCPVRTSVLKNFAKFTGKHLFQSLFFNKVAGHLSHQNRSERTKRFPVKLSKIVKFFNF